MQAALGGCRYCGFTSTFSRILLRRELIKARVKSASKTSANEAGSGTLVAVLSGGGVTGGAGKAVDGGGKAPRIGSPPFGFGKGGCDVGGDGVGDGTAVGGSGSFSGVITAGGCEPGTGEPALSLPATGTGAAEAPAVPGVGGAMAVGDGVRAERSWGIWSAPVGALMNEAASGAVSGCPLLVE